ncbi:hypothetical protein MLE13_10525, partial [Planococcus halocryophilus]|nr:hypothetical protein [Planococcus halocryophilus]
VMANSIKVAKISSADFNEEALTWTVEEFTAQDFEAFGVKVNIWFFFDSTVLNIPYSEKSS